MTSETAYIIHERPHNERTRFAVVFTQTNGTDCVAITSKKRITYFCEYQIITKRNRIALESAIESPEPLTGKALYCAMYLNELIYRFCKPRDPHPQLYEDYRLCLRQLGETKNIEAILRYFELRLLKASGYEIDTHHIRSPYVTFSKDAGFVECYEPKTHSISLHSLNQMTEKMVASNDVKLFFRHIINTLLPQHIQSGIFYEKITHPS